MRTVIRGVSTITDRALQNMARLSPGYKIERDDDGSLVVSPTDTDGHYKEAEALRQLLAYEALAGGKAGGASVGFPDPRGGVRSPDVSWLSAESIERLTEERTRQAYVRITPDVIIEIASPSDDWHEDGARYSVASNPTTRRQRRLERRPRGSYLTSTR